MPNGTLQYYQQSPTVRQAAPLYNPPAGTPTFGQDRAIQPPQMQQIYGPQGPRRETPRAFEAPQATQIPTQDDFFAGGAGPQAEQTQSNFRSMFSPNDYQSYIQEAMKKLEEEEREGKGYFQPYYEAGGKGLQAYLASLGLAGGQAQQGALDTFRASPGYQYAVQQAMRGAQRGMAATGMTGSGAEAAELQRRAEGMAEQEYGGYQQRLGTLAGMGQQTAGALAQLGRGYGEDVAGLYSALGKAQMEKQLMEEQMKQQRESSMWGTLGQIGGSLIGAFL